MSLYFTFWAFSMTVEPLSDYITVILAFSTMETSGVFRSRTQHCFRILMSAGSKRLHL